MKRIKIFGYASALALISATGAFADCDVPDGPEITAMTATFPAYVAVAEEFRKCPNVDVELDLEVRTKAKPALDANPALYDIVSVHNDTIVQFLEAGTLRPLDDLVAKYGQGLNDNQLIRINGKVMAVALMVNLKHMMYRQDIFDDLGIEPPTTYDEMLAAAEKIREAGVVDYPLGMTYKGDWNIAAAFNDMFAAYGGTFVNEDNTPNLNSEAGMKTLEMMKRVTEYLDPEYLVSDSTFVQQQLQQGKIAMAPLWASRAGAMDDPNESQFVGKISGSVAPSPAEGTTPASMLYWDGLAIATNISDAEAERAFQVIVAGADEDLMAAANDAAVWLIKGYQPSRMAQAAIDTAAAGAISSPSANWKGMVISAAGNNVPDFLNGTKTAEQTLEAMEEEYIISAKEAGLLE